jgi:hypothetical protein
LTGLIAVAVLLLGFLGWSFLRNYRRYHGRMQVTCPETHHAAGVRVDVAHAVLSGTLGKTDLRLKSCTRWPDHRKCGQACLAQIEAAPADCLVRRILADWFHDKSCVLCGRVFEDINWHDHKPALADAAGRFVDWHTLPVDKLDELLASHQPVCWNCHVAETFRRQHPERVTDRPVPQHHAM